jgi:hypothetical protein
MTPKVKAEDGAELTIDEVFILFPTLDPESLDGSGSAKPPSRAGWLERDATLQEKDNLTRPKQFSLILHPEFVEGG